MTSIHRAPVVAGVDGSPDSLVATDVAAGEAARRHLPLRLVHGLRPPAAYSFGALVAIDVSSILADLREMLHTVATDVQGRYPDLTIETSVTAGDPAGVLVEESRTASLVVVGSRGLGGIRGMLAGSVSAQVAAHAHAPVIVVRPPTAWSPCTPGRPRPPPTSARSPTATSIRSRRSRRPTGYWRRYWPGGRRSIRTWPSNAVPCTASTRWTHS